MVINVVSGFFFVGPSKPLFKTVEAPEVTAKTSNQGSPNQSEVAAIESKSEEPKKELMEKPKVLPLLTPEVEPNTYATGNCTWYAKQMRPDLPDNLGNADTWYERAQAQGIEVGTEPVEGAIGQSGMHVVFVEKVNNDGTIIISEMNYQGLGVIDQRKLPANSFQYIY
jgi:surface antigen